MENIFDKLREDIRYEEGLKACINCGVCTAICPAAEFYEYDPRLIVNVVQSRDEEKLLELLKSDTIWYCGQCMSCKTRCPRENVPGFIIMALRKLSQEEGYFTESEKGRQQFAIKRTVGENILKYGYCIVPQEVKPDLHPEQGPAWEWVYENTPEVMNRLGANYEGEGGGILRKISDETLEEISRIFEVSGCYDLFDKIESYSKIKADQMGLDFGKGIENEYFVYTYNRNSNNHSHPDQ
jgi:heterodisulfide reductase subunit C1